ncbi:MAG: hypothetical protein E7057_08745 [Lentisphaerae bacterium]|nr:hypothetical protein [Lentisphaerota bacterium]
MNIRLPELTSKFRPSPFWSWNADLKPEELRRQIRLMHEAGLGGFFMHARGGLQTAYLSREWMECVEASLDEAGKLGMDAWLYDENGWPSGFGGGLVNGLGEKYQAKYLRCEVIDAADAAEKENTLGFYTENGETFYGTTLPAGISGRIMRCYYEVNPYYVDNLDAEVVAEFIRVTHQHYYENIPQNILKHLRGIFTDEPQLSRNGVVWSFIIEDAYFNAYNSELRPLLPQLFVDLPQSSQTRIRFWKLCSDVFSKAFMKQIRDWCVAHNWELTGHHVLEEFLCYQNNSNGSIMPQYRYYTLPGVDHLGRSTPSAVAATQLFSVGQQYGLKQLLTESFACTGWACNFSGMRWIYQQQMAHGVNYLCQHLQSYSLRGRRKRDYPQSGFYHQPWWEDYKLLNDYFSQVGRILAEGKLDVETLVIHPMSSMWKVFVGKYNLRDFASQKSLEQITAELDARTIQHHYADEIIVDECGSVDKDRFIIGNCSYRVVIIPQVTNLSRKIFDLLKKFHRNGGIILRVRETERVGSFTIDGVPAAADELEFLDKLTAFNSETAAAEYAAGCITDRVIITENNVPATSVIATWRDIEIAGFAGRFYYLVNTNYRSGTNVWINLPFTGKKIAVIGQTDGEFYRPAKVIAAENSTFIEHNFGAADALMLFAADELPVEELPQEVRIAADAAAIRLLPENSWQISKATENILTLERCRFRIDGGQWQCADAIDAQTKLLDLERCCDLELEYDFNVADDFDFNTPVDLAVEVPESFRFTLNGQEFAIEHNGYLFDKAFERIKLPANFRKGLNTIGMKTRFEQDDNTYETIRKARIFESEYNKLTFNTEIESVYLCGDFAVHHDGTTVSVANNATRLNGSFALGAKLSGDIVKCTNLITEGMPFFAGKVTLKNSFTLTPEEAKSIRFFTCQVRGSNSIKVKVNGIDCGGAFWEPFAVPVKNALQMGVNTIEIELTISLRNMLGPHHLLEGESFWIGTCSFNRESTLMRNAPSPSTPAFCMVDFGITDLKFTR